MAVRGIRGATTASANTREEILAATREMLEILIEANNVDSEEVASAHFSTTPDLTAEFPAVAARELGWTMVPLLCGHEMSVPGSLPMTVRVLVHVNTDVPQSGIHHVYLRGARALRPDLQSSSHSTAR